MSTSVQQPGRTLAIGDVHGCADALRQLTSSLALQPSDTLVVLGDVIDRGPDSRGVLELLLELRGVCQLVCLLGNHEQMMLESIDGVAPVQEWLVHGGAETLDSYGLGAAPHSIDRRHIEFVRSWGDLWETPAHFFVHGGYLSTLPLSRQPWPDMRWQSLKWQVPRPHVSGKTAIVGHTANKRGEIVNLGHLICIDTYCHGGGWLTALEPETGRVWQSDRQGAFREGRLPAAVAQYYPN